MKTAWRCSADSRPRRHRARRRNSRFAADYENEDEDEDEDEKSLTPNIGSRVGAGNHRAKR